MCLCRQTEAWHCIMQNTFNVLFLLPGDLHFPSSSSSCRAPPHIHAVWSSCSWSGLPVGGGDFPGFDCSSWAKICFSDPSSAVSQPSSRCNSKPMQNKNRGTFNQEDTSFWTPHYVSPLLLRLAHFQAPSFRHVRNSHFLHEHMCWVLETPFSTAGKNMQEYMQNVWKT